MLLRRILSWMCQDRTPIYRPLRLQEELESRIVLDNYLWLPGTGPHNWSYVYTAGLTNWARQTEDGEWVSTTGIPGIGDTAYFRGKAGRNADCTVDVPVNVDSIDMGEGYSKDLILKKSLTTTHISNMESGTIRGLLNDDGTRNTLTVAPGATFLWKGGRLFSLNVDVSRNQNAAGNLAVAQPIPGNTRLMAGADFNIYGFLTWTAGDVVLAPHANQFTSNIRVFSDGQFTIRAAGKTWGCSVESLGCVAPSNVA
jgi:hypothetical protein